MDIISWIHRCICKSLDLPLLATKTQPDISDQEKPAIQPRPYAHGVYLPKSLAAADHDVPGRYIQNVPEAVQNCLRWLHIIETYIKPKLASPAGAHKNATSVLSRTTPARHLSEIVANGRLLDS